MLLNKNNLNIWKFCSTEESRFVLRAMLVTKHETVATDGHRLVRVTVPKMNESLFPTVPDFKADDVDGSLLLHADVAKEIAASIPKGEQSIPVLSTAKLGQDKGGARAVTTDLDLHHLIEGRKVEGDFPKWEGIIPTNKPAFELCLDPRLLAEVAQFASRFADRPVMRIQFFGSDKAIRFDAEDKLNGQGMTAMLMPVRSTSEWEFAYKNGAGKKSDQKQTEISGEGPIPPGQSSETERVEDNEQRGKQQ